MPVRVVSPIQKGRTRVRAIDMALSQTLSAPVAPRPGPLSALARLWARKPAEQNKAPPAHLPAQLRRDIGTAPQPQAAPSTGAAMLHLLR